MARRVAFFALLFPVAALRLNRAPTARRRLARCAARDAEEDARAGCTRQGAVRSAAAASLAAFVAATARGAAAASENGQEVWRLPIVDVPPLDKRKYQALGLQNGLRVLLISDPATETAAAAMNVHVGHFSDPEAVPGLAHFCEHMLFLGTAKYPAEDDFNAFLASHGGKSNAFTAPEDTNYYFDVTPEHLAAGLDRFASFFVEPLFTASATDRELNAIDSEHAKNLQADTFRLYQLEKSRANPEHPFHKFGTGNRETLRPGADLRNALLDFHARYYRARAMTLCVYGRESLAELEKQVTQRFAAVPAGEPEIRPLGADGRLRASRAGPRSPQWFSLETDWMGVPPFLTPAVTKAAGPLAVYEVEPASAIRRLVVSWPLPHESEAQKALRVVMKPDYFITWLLGHEGVGSPTYILKKEGLLNALGADVSEETVDFQCISFLADLTEKGLQPQGRERILEVVFGYLDVLRKQGLPDYIVQECRTINDLAWKYLERADTTNYVSALAGNMQKYPTPCYVSGSMRLGGEGDISKVLRDEALEAPPAGRGPDLTVADLVASLTARMTPTNALFSVIAPGPELAKLESRARWEMEPIYSTRFRRTEMPASLAATITEPGPSREALLAQGMGLPQPNPYLPGDLRLKSRPVQVARRPGQSVPGPQVLKQNADTRTWDVYFKQDRTFQRPRAQVLFNVASQAPESSPRNVVLAKLLEFQFENDIGAQSYPALLGGISGGLELNARGMRISFGGYNDKLLDYAKFYVDRLVNYAGPTDDAFETADAKFARAKDVVQRELRSWTTQQPYVHASYELALVTEDPKFYVGQLERALADIDLESFRAFARRGVWEGRPGKALLQGNLEEGDARAYQAILDGAIKPKLWESDTVYLPALQQREILATPRRLLKLLPATPRGQGNVFRRKEPNVANDNSAVYALFQVPQPDDRQRAAMDLLASVLEEPFYDELRTRQQLGYLTFSGPKQQEKACGLVCIVQSQDKDPAYLADRIFAFLAGARQAILAPITAARWSEYAAAIAQKKLEPDQRLAQEVSRHWTEVQTGDLRWDRNIEEAEALLSVAAEGPAAMLRFFDEVVGEGGSRRRVAVSEVFCRRHEGAMGAPVPEGSRLVPDSVAFKEQLSYLEDAVPQPVRWI